MYGYGYTEGPCCEDCLTSVDVKLRYQDGPYRCGPCHKRALLQALADKKAKASDAS